MDKEAIINNFNQSLINLSLEAEEQIASFPEFAVVTDELLLDFDHFYTVLKGNYNDFFSDQQIKILDKINLYIDKISSKDLFVSELEELKTYNFWKQLRILSREAILILNIK